MLYQLIFIITTSLCNILNNHKLFSSYDIKYVFFAAYRYFDWFLRVFYWNLNKEYEEKVKFISYLKLIIGLLYIYIVYLYRCSIWFKANTVFLKCIKKNTFVCE